MGNFDLRVKVKPGEPFTEQANREELMMIIQTIQNDETLKEYISARGGMIPLYRALFTGNGAIPNDTIDEILGVADGKDAEGADKPGDFQQFMKARMGEVQAAEQGATAALGGGGGGPEALEGGGAPPPQGGGALNLVR